MAPKTIVAAVLFAACASHRVVAQSSASAAAAAAPSIPSWAAFDPTGYSGFKDTLNQQFASMRTDYGSKVNSAVGGISSGLLGLGVEAAQLVADLPTIPLGSLGSQIQAETCAPATIVEPVIIPTQCVGSTYEYTISGGYCVVTGEAGPVTCKKPSIELTTQGSFCNLATKTPTQIKDVSCSSVNTFDALTTSGIINGGKSTTYELSAVQAPAPDAGMLQGSGSSASAAASSGGKKSQKKSNNKNNS